MRLAKGGAIAGIVFAALVLFDVIFGSFPAVLPGIRLAGAGLEAVFILLLSWRIWTGVRDGVFGVAWLAAYFGLGLMMLNAIRACLRHDTYSRETAPARTA